MCQPLLSPQALRQVACPLMCTIIGTGNRTVRAIGPAPSSPTLGDALNELGGTASMWMGEGDKPQMEWGGVAPGEQPVRKPITICFHLRRRLLRQPQWLPPLATPFWTSS